MAKESDQNRGADIEHHADKNSLLARGSIDPRVKERMPSLTSPEGIDAAQKYLSEFAENLDKLDAEDDIFGDAKDVKTTEALVSGGAFTSAGPEAPERDAAPANPVSEPDHADTGNSSDDEADRVVATLPDARMQEKAETVSLAPDAAAAPEDAASAESALPPEENNDPAMPDVPSVPAAQTSQELSNGYESAPDIEEHDNRETASDARAADETASTEQARVDRVDAHEDVLSDGASSVDALAPDTLENADGVMGDDETAAGARAVHTGMTDTASADARSQEAPQQAMPADDVFSEIPKETLAHEALSDGSSDTAQDPFAQDEPGEEDHAQRSASAVDNGLPEPSPYANDGFGFLGVSEGADQETGSSEYQDSFSRSDMTQEAAEHPENRNGSDRGAVHSDMGALNTDDYEEAWSRHPFNEADHVKPGKPLDDYLSDDQPPDIFHHDEDKDPFSGESAPKDDEALSFLSDDEPGGRMGKRDARKDDLSMDDDRDPLQDAFGDDDSTRDDTQQPDAMDDDLPGQDDAARKRKNIFLMMAAAIGGGVLVVAGGLYLTSPGGIGGSTSQVQPPPAQELPAQEQAEQPPEIDRPPLEGDQQPPVFAERPGTQLSDLVLLDEPDPEPVEPAVTEEDLEAIELRLEQTMMESLERLDESLSDLMAENMALASEIRAAESRVSQAVDRAERAEELALAQNDVLVEFVRLQDQVKVAEGLIVDLSRRMADLERLDPVDRNEVETQLMELHQRLAGLSRDVGLVARMALNPDSGSGASTVSPRRGISGSSMVYEDDASGVAAVPSSHAVPDDVEIGDHVSGYGAVLDIMPTADGARLIVMENGSVLVE